MKQEFDVLVVGSINVDMVVAGPALPKPGTTVTGGQFDVHHGGKGANQAVAAARLSARTAMIAAVGEDQHGIDAIANLPSEGVDSTNVAQIPEVPTGVALIVVDASGENQIAVASGANELLTGEMVSDALETVVLAPDGVVVIGFEIPDAAVDVAAGWASGFGHTVVLDPAPARRLSEAVVASHPIVTPNTEEAAGLTGVHDLMASAKALYEITDSAVLVTLGDGGVLVYEDGSGLVVPPHPAQVVDTTGAGDAFVGGLAAGLSEAMTFRAAVDFAQTVAALSTQSAGARSGMPRREHLP